MNHRSDTASPAQEVGLPCASGKDTYSAGVSDSALIRELTPGHLTPEVFEQWCRTKAKLEGCDPVAVALEYAWLVILG